VEDTNGVGALLEQLGTYGAPLVITALVLYFSVKFGNLLFDHYGRKLEISRRLLDARIQNSTQLQSAQLPSLPQVYEDGDQEGAEPVSEHGVIDLLDHPFFQRMDMWHRYDIPRLPIKSKFHRLVVTDFLLIKYRVFKNGIVELVNDRTIMELTPAELAVKVISTLVALIDQYERETKELNIPEPVLTKFKTLHSPSMVFILKMAEDCCRGRLFQTNARRIEAVLNTLLFAFEVALVDAENTLGTMNGELEGLVYRGVRNTCHSEPTTRTEYRVLSDDPRSRS